MEWRLKSDVLGTYEIENALVSDTYQNFINRNVRMVDTSICYNNDYALNDLLKENKSAKVISKIPPQMTLDYEFVMKNHLRCLGRDKIDIMLIHNPRSDWSTLAVRLEDDDRIKETGVSNFSIDDLKRYKDLMGHYPAYNEMEINPEYYNKDLIKFCHNHDIQIIAYAIFGGKYNARKNIARYTLPYLLTFVGRIAEYVIIRSDNHTRLGDMMNFLRYHDAILSENEINESIFNLPSTTNKSIVPTSYTYPIIFTQADFVTNSDQISLSSNNMIFASSFDFNKEDIEDELGYGSAIAKMGKYEFVSDYRVMLRYLTDNYLHEETGKWPKGSYIYPSTYAATSYKHSIWDKFLGKLPKPLRSVSVTLNLMGRDNGKISKVLADGVDFYVQSKVTYYK
jgi:diketogulonate reductase-like aldo/keto reductase